MSDEFDPFKGSSGLELDGKDGTITDVWFAKGDNDTSGNISAMIKVEGTGYEPQVQQYRCGPDWESIDSGITLIHPKGDKQLFNVNTKYQKFIQAAIDSGAGDVLRGRYAEDPTMTPRNSKLLIGLSFHWEAKVESGTLKDKETKQTVEWQSTTILPTKFLGIGEVTGDAGNNGSGPLGTVDEETQGKIKELATTLEFPAFQEAVLGLTEATKSDKLVAALANENLYREIRAEASAS